MFIKSGDNDDNNQNDQDGDDGGDDDDGDNNISWLLRSFNLQQFPQVFDLFNKFLKRLDRFLVGFILIISFNEKMPLFRKYL